MNFADEVLSALRREPNKVVLSFSDESITSDQLLDMVAEIGCSVGLNDMPRGVRVLINISRPDTFFVVYHAVLKANAIAIPIASANDGGEFLQPYIDRVRPHIIIHDLQEPLKINLGVYSQSTCRCGQFRLGILRRHMSIDDLSASLREIDAASIMFTTGTGGQPKGVVVSHLNLNSTLKKNIQFMKYDFQTVEVNSLPIEHSFGLGQCNAAIAAGGTVHFVKGMSNLKQVFQVVSQTKATSFPTTPAGIALLAGRYLDVFAMKFSSIQTFMINSAPMPPNLTVTLREHFPNARIMVYYGLTEASRSSFADLTDLPVEQLSNVGKPLGNTRISIQPESREILISGDNVSPAYFQSHDKPLRKRQSQFFNTGDVGKLDGQGDLVILGRIGDEINVGGYKVDPLEIEKFAEARFGNGAFCLCGVETADAMVDLVLLVNRSAAQHYGMSTIIDALSSKFESWKCPGHFFEVDEIPSKLNGKLDRSKSMEVAKGALREKTS